MSYKEYTKLDFTPQYIAKGYDQQDWPILNEYFSRYKHEFGLSDSEIQHKLNVVLSNLDKIDTAGKSKDDHIGVYYSAKKRISINSAKLQAMGSSFEDILNTIFHELNHAGENSLSDESTSFKQYNSNTERYEGIAINEIITEMKSSRLAKNDRVDLTKKTGEFRSVLDLQGYSDLIFVGSMMHTALGISEKEFLQYADKGRAAFDAQMESKFPTGQDYDIYMQNMIFYSDVLHACKYNRERKGPYTEEELYNIRNSINGIYSNCLGAMSKIVPYQAFLNRNNMDLKEYMTKVRFDMEKLKANYRYGLSYHFDEQTINFSENGNVNRMQDIIACIEETHLHRGDLNEFQYADALANISSQNPFFAKKYIETNYGIVPSETLMDFDRTMDLSYEISILNAEYGQDIWNNEECNEYVKNFLKKQKFLTRIFNKLNSRGHRTEHKALPAAEKSTHSNKFTGEMVDLVVKDDEYLAFQPNNRDLGDQQLDDR